MVRVGTRCISMVAGAFLFAMVLHFVTTIIGVSSVYSSESFLMLVLCYVLLGGICLEGQ